MNITEATSLFSEAQVAPVSYVDLSLVKMCIRDRNRRET